MNYNESLEYLSNFSKQGAPVSDLSRFAALCGALNNPERALKCVHIVGTNGKGSVAEYVSCGLRACGYLTGRFTSPYIIDIRERITLDGEFISKEDFARIMTSVRAAVDNCAEKAFSQFELLTAVCFLYFAEKRADWCVLEAGIGGTLDCTNVIPCPAAAVFTSIGLDHTALLGTTCEEIARSKSGVIKGGTVVAAAGIPAQAMDVIREKCRQSGARLVVPNTAELSAVQGGLWGNSFCYCGAQIRTKMCGAHQITNALTAAETLRALEGVDYSRAVAGFAAAEIPARLESIAAQGFPQIILDGGHNPQAMAAAREVLLADARPKTALIGMIDTKDYETALAEILPCFGTAVFLDGFAPNAVDSKRLCAAANGLCQAYESHAPHDALALAARLTPRGGLLFIGGSLYMAAEIRRLLCGGAP